jgi:hypothetical protein
MTRIREIYQTVEAWVLAKQERTWVGHGLAGFVGGFTLDIYGAGALAGWYAHHEYVDWKNKSSTTLDYVMDWVSAVVGGFLGVLARRVLL